MSRPLPRGCMVITTDPAAEHYRSRVCAAIRAFRNDEADSPRFFAISESCIQALCCAEALGRDKYSLANPLQRKRCYPMQRGSRNLGAWLHLKSNVFFCVLRVSNYLKVTKRDPPPAFHQFALSSVLISDRSFKSNPPLLGFAMFFRTQLLVSALFAVSSVLGTPGEVPGAFLTNSDNFRLAAFKAGTEHNLNPSPYGFELVLEPLNNNEPREFGLVVSTVLHRFDVTTN